MLRAILNKSWRQHPTKQQLYGHLPLITKTIKVRWTRHAGHYGRSRDELISYVLLWTPSRERAKAGRPARTYIQQLCTDTVCSPEDLPEAMDDREGWREKVRDIRGDDTTWWWWYFVLIYISYLLSQVYSFWYGKIAAYELYRITTGGNHASITSSYFWLAVTPGHNGFKSLSLRSLHTKLTF